MKQIYTNTEGETFKDGEEVYTLFNGRSKGTATLVYRDYGDDDRTGWYMSDFYCELRSIDSFDWVKKISVYQIERQEKKRDKELEETKWWQIFKRDDINKKYSKKIYEIKNK